MGRRSRNLMGAGEPREHRQRVSSDWRPTRTARLKLEDLAMVAAESAGALGSSEQLGRARLSGRPHTLRFPFFLRVIG